MSKRSARDVALPHHSVWHHIMSHHIRCGFCSSVSLPIYSLIVKIDGDCLKEQAQPISRARSSLNSSPLRSPKLNIQSVVCRPDRQAMV